MLAYAPPKRDEGALCHLVEVQKGCTYNGVQAPPIGSFVFEKANFWEMNIKIERFVNLLIVTSTEARSIEYCRF